MCPHLSSQEVKSFATPLSDAPSKPGLDGADVLVEVIAIEAEASLQAEAVTGTQPLPEEIGGSGQRPRWKGVRQTICCKVIQYKAPKGKVPP